MHWYTQLSTRSCRKKNTPIYFKLQIMVVSVARTKFIGQNNHSDRLK